MAIQIRFCILDMCVLHSVTGSSTTACHQTPPCSNQHRNSRVHRKRALPELELQYYNLNVTFVSTYHQTRHTAPLTVLTSNCFPCIRVWSVEGPQTQPGTHTGWYVGFLSKTTLRPLPLQAFALHPTPLETLLWTSGCKRSLDLAVLPSERCCAMLWGP